MLTWDKALAHALARTPVLLRRCVPLESATGFVLAEPLIARNDSPPFDTSAVDGFAVHPRDVAGASNRRPVLLRLIASVHAGHASKTRIKRGTAIKIMTGACVPPGARAIVMREFCREESATVSVCRAVTSGENIRPRRGEFRKRQTVLPSGVLITPPVAGLLAAFGYAAVHVYPRPTVTIVVTGDELLSPSQRLRPGKIRDANSYALAAAVQILGVEACEVFRVGDRPAALRRHLASAVRNSDVLLVAGGMSVGDRDYVRAVLDEIGVKEQFWRVAVKPGKPAYFGMYTEPSSRRNQATRSRRRQGCLVFGLPGNPVSALVCFHQLVKPVLWKMMGRQVQPALTLKVRLVGERRKPRGRLEWVRGMLSYAREGMCVRPATGQDSHMLGGLAEANCLIRFPKDAEHLADGVEVEVEVLSWHE